LRICAVESGSRNCLAQLGNGEGVGGGGGGVGGHLLHHQDRVLELDKLSQLYDFLCESVVVKIGIE
jgi:hypothetical protein